MTKFELTPTRLRDYWFPSLFLPKDHNLRPPLGYDLARTILLFWFWTFHRIKFRGQNAIPRQGPVILCPNHVSYYDPPVVGIGVPFGLKFMAWDALFRIPLFKQFIEFLGAFPVRLKSADKGAIETTLSVLRAKQVLTIFPEGGRSFTGELMPFEVGAFRMAVQVGAPIVPVTISGIFETWPPYQTLPKLFTPLIVKYHAPIAVPTNIPRAQLKEEVEKLREEVRRVIDRRMRAAKRLKAMKSTRGIWS